MKRSGVGELVRLTRQYLADEKEWGETEIMSEASAAAASAPAGTIVKLEDPATLEAFRNSIAECRNCPLGATRIKFVFGSGSPQARLMFVGEGPGYEEDRQGEPFVGKAGQLLTKIIEAIGLRRDEVYIANVVKCHPLVDPSDPEKRGNDRPPSPEEIAACFPYLERQIAIIRPDIICALGTWAARTLLATETAIGRLRGRFHEFNGIRVMPTYHPAALLRNPDLKKDVWEDMKMIRAQLQKPH